MKPLKEFFTSLAGMFLTIAVVIIMGSAVACGSASDDAGLTTEHTERYVQLDNGMQCTEVSTGWHYYLICPPDAANREAFNP